jgi:hypothetical protein
MKLRQQQSYVGRFTFESEHVLTREDAQTALLNTGVLLGNPIPEEFSIPMAEMNIAIDAAIKEAAEKGFTGHANTPFILSKIKELTDGKSLPANRALIESNVARAARIAVEFSKLLAIKNPTWLLANRKKLPKSKVPKAPEETAKVLFSPMGIEHRKE